MQAQRHCLGWGTVNAVLVSEDILDVMACRNERLAPHHPGRGKGGTVDQRDRGLGDVSWVDAKSNELHKEFRKAICLCLGENRMAGGKSDK